MFGVASPLQIALALSALVWPLAAGLGLVLWSKARAAERARREAALDRELSGMFRTVEGRPVPERLALVVEALEEAQAMQAQPGPAAKPARAPVTAS